MAHFAELDENDVVLRVIVVHNNELLDGEESESEQLGIDFCVAHFGGSWIQTSYNANFRKHYASAGFTYDPIADVFIQPQPYPSWTLDSNHDWQAPTPLPVHTPGEFSWTWNEETLAWDAEEINDDPASVI
jgi:hypothetical protein